MCNQGMQRGQNPAATTHLQHGICTVEGALIPVPTDSIPFRWAGSRRHSQFCLWGDQNKAGSCFSRAKFVRLFYDLTAAWYDV